MRLLPLVGLLFSTTLFGANSNDASSPGARATATVVVDATAFLDHIPLRDTLIDGAGAAVDGAPAGDALFNHYGIVFNTETNLHHVQEIAQPGTYRLYVRSQGSGRSGFRVSIDGKLSPATFGKTPALALVDGGTFELNKGPVRIVLTRISRGATFDALFLTKASQLTETDLPALEFSPDAVVLKEYPTGRGTPKFGDVDGDGRMDVLSVEVGGAVSVFNYEGTKLWSWQPAEAASGQNAAFAGYEPPGLIWDMDHDGKAEVIHWRLIDGSEKLVVADGLTGVVKHSTDWPTPPRPHEYFNFRVAVANLTGGYPSDIVVFTDAGNDYKSVTAYTADLKQRWTDIEHLQKDHLGHYAYPVDVNGDGIDEVFVSGLALDSAGKKLWERRDILYDNHDHCDSFRFADINGDGRIEALCPTSDIGVSVFDALTGKVLWQRPADHAQQLEWGSFLAGKNGPQLAVNGRFYANGQSGRISALVHWFDTAGNEVATWPSRPLNGNPDFVKGDWRGDGRQELFWHQFRMKPDGTGEIYFADTVVHMFDFDGNGTDDVITRGGPGVRVYTCANPTASGKRKVTDSNQVRQKVANLTHY